MLLTMMSNLIGVRVTHLEILLHLKLIINSILILIILQNELKVSKVTSSWKRRLRQGLWGSWYQKWGESGAQRDVWWVHVMGPMLQSDRSESSLSTESSEHCYSQGGAILRLKALFGLWAPWSGSLLAHWVNEGQTDEIWGELDQDFYVLNAQRRGIHS
jgi:hypothetical protein